MRSGGRRAHQLGKDPRRSPAEITPYSIVKLRPAEAHWADETTADILGSASVPRPAEAVWFFLLFLLLVFFLAMVDPFGGLEVIDAHADKQVHLSPSHRRARYAQAHHRARRQHLCGADRNSIHGSYRDEKPNTASWIRGVTYAL